MKSIFEMTGPEKAASLLIALGPDIASEIIKYLDEESIKKVTEEIAKIDQLNVKDKEDLIGEFLIDLRKKRGTLYGGDNVARDILVAALGENKAREVIDKLTRKDLEKGFDFLREIDSEILVSFLQNEHPQTITVTLAHLPSAKSAEILKSLAPVTAKEVAKRIAKMDKTSPDAVIEIARVIRKKYEKLKESGKYEIAGGVDTLVSILNHMSGEQEKMIMDHINHAIPTIAKEIKDRIYTFDNVLYLSNEEIRILIDEINDDLLIAKALKGAGDDIRFRFLRNMSRNRATDILTDMDSMGPLRLSEIQDARDEIISIMRQLHDYGVISLRKEREKYIE
jgi:flagellar motor switch protein FliG